MHKRHLILINIVFVGLMLFSAGMVYQFLTGNKPLAVLHNLTHHARAVSVETTGCGSERPIANLGTSGDAQLRKLDLYQQACHSLATATMMTFTGMPTSQQDGVDTAKAFSAKLKAFAAAGVRPLVIAEPADSAGNNLDYALLANGTYDPWLDAYFSQLKTLGVTDKQLGIWNPFPEANLPYWKNNQPTYFAPAVNHYLSILRYYFPTAQTSIMLNSATYQTTDFNWENGDYESLLPYVKGITPGLVTYAGLQGFPWAPPQGGSGPILNAAEFLSPGLLSEMATSLQVKQVWFNTGTFSTKYTLDPNRTVYITPEQRKEILGTIESQALVLQKKGFQVSVNIFAKDKSKTTEETNWAYWANNKPFNSLSTPVLTDFIKTIKSQKIDFWVFDS